MLVSICDSNPRSSCLVLLDLESHAKRWVDVGLGGGELYGGLGLVADERFVYHLSFVGPEQASHLSVLDRASLEVVHTQALPEVADGHSLVRRGDELVVVSTGTDEIIAYRLDGPRATDPHLLWTPTGSGSDTHHVNSATVVDGELLCSAFGAKTGEAWASATEGYIRNVTTGTTVVAGLRQPHTATWHDGLLYFCNSAMGTVDSTVGPVASLAGYSRGLAFDADGSLYTATSVGRPWSEMAGRCAVVQISPGGMRTEIGLAPFGAEVYDLLLL